MLKPGFLPFGPPESRDGGECFASLVYYDLLCAAARRNAEKRCPRPPENASNYKKSEFWATLKVTFFI